MGDGHRNGIHWCGGTEGASIYTLVQACFAFKLTDLESYKGKPGRIQLEDDHPVFRGPYRLSLSERDGVKVRCKELLDAGLVELSDGEYACATVMPTKKDVLGNWTEKRMCGDYHPFNIPLNTNLVYRWFVHNNTKSWILYL